MCHTAVVASLSLLSAFVLHVGMPAHLRGAQEAELPRAPFVFLAPSLPLVGQRAMALRAPSCSGG